MAAFTSKDVMDLRARTGAGMMDCKKALTEADGDMDKAVTILREKGAATAAKKAGRVAAEGIVESYIHMGGKIGVMVEATQGASAEVVHDVALQIAAANAQYVCREEVPQSEVDHEKEILKAQALNEDSKKPEAIIEKMLVGRINKFYKDVCLNEQVFVKNGDLTISQYLKQNGDVKVIRFTRYAMGEGLQKREDDFVGEVMAQAHLAK